MEAKILLKETIKPSSPTPKHLENYKLSLLDQLTPPLYIPIILFYSSQPNHTPIENSGHLKKSLSETLTAFYPLAGRIKDCYSIDCNDQGASYTEAQFPVEMSTILQNPNISQLEKLLPFDPHNQITSNDAILAVQVNRFDCGGMAISICIWHRIADASAAASVATSWASVASGAITAINIEGSIFDCTSIFPPQDTRTISYKLHVENDLLSNISTKRFIFHSSKLADLRNKIVANNGSGTCPTRVETVASIILSAVSGLSTSDKDEDNDTNISVAAVAVNLRKRMNPPFPQLSLGSIFQVATSVVDFSKNENSVEEYGDLTGKIHESIANMKDGYVRKMHEGGKYFELFRRSLEEKAKVVKNVFAFSSWCRFPYYEADFGFGKPVWVSTALKLYKVAIFIDTKDGEGIEAWVSLPEEDMVKFQRNPEICSYASFNPTT